MRFNEGGLDPEQIAEEQTRLPTVELSLNGSQFVMGLYRNTNEGVNIFVVTGKSQYPVSGTKTIFFL